MKIFLYDFEEKFLFPSKINRVSSYDDLDYKDKKYSNIENQVDQNRHATVIRTCSSISIFSENPIVCKNLSFTDSRNPLEKQKAKKVSIGIMLRPKEIYSLLFLLSFLGKQVPSKKKKIQFVAEDLNYRMILTKFGFLDFSFNPTISIE